jgi:hypothetical protein
MSVSVLKHSIRWLFKVDLSAARRAPRRRQREDGRRAQKGAQAD